MTTYQPPEQLLADAVGEVAAIADPLERQRAALRLIEELARAMLAAKVERREAVIELRQGRTLAKVGELLGGLSGARVDQILKGR